MKISPSFLTCDFSRLKEEIDTVAPYCEYIHVDVMDGMFVPNLTIGPKIIGDLRKHYTNVFDVHLMIEEPIRYIKEFCEAGSDIVTIHFEACSDVLQTILEIKKYNKKVGLSIKPNTLVDDIKQFLDKVDLVLVMSVEPGFGGQKFMLNSVDKIKQLVDLRSEFNYTYEIEVDGGINYDTISYVKDAMIDVVVCGSYLMNSDNKEETISLLRNK